MMMLSTDGKLYHDAHITLACSVVLAQEASSSTYTQGSKIIQISDFKCPQQRVQSAIAELQWLALYRSVLCMCSRSTTTL
jgi:hypothetical protein